MKVLLLGLGRANSAVAQYLVERNELVYLYEDHPEGLSHDARELLSQGKISEYADIAYDLVVASPGFPVHKEVVTKMKVKGVPVVDELEFTYQQLDNPRVIAVTGTNGKSTTAALISAVLTAGGVQNFLGGNISPGHPFSYALFENPYDYYVLEVSSFQLMRISKFCPYIAVLTNISSDHLNWHSDFDEYIHAKLRIFMNQSETHYAVLNADDQIIQTMSSGIRARKVLYGKEEMTGGHLNGRFWYRSERLFPVSQTSLPGFHNAMNILAAICVGKLCGIRNEAITKGITEFKGLPHRLENLGIVNGVRYINNSMCTNEEAAIKSFRAVVGSKIVIVGGSQKGHAATQYLMLLVKEAKACVVLGANADTIAGFFKVQGYTAFTTAADMKEAVQVARSYASTGDIVMLNPGFASFGLYRNFEERGVTFKDAVFAN